MARERWIFRETKELSDFIAAQDEVVRTKINLDIKKLESRGGDAVDGTLVKPLKGGVFYLRSRVGNKLIRCFFFRSGPTEVCGFHGYDKTGRGTLPRRITKKVLRLYEELKEKGGCS
jgi:Phage derived protein Gp49-like (DUF891)